jgi:hypothetical protein
MTFLTDDEIQSVNASKLPADTPFLICGVSMSYFSIARHYGGCKVQGRTYTYLPDSDELIRDDVLKFVKKLRKQKEPKQC